jgi:hypothetical protein
MHRLIFGDNQFFGINHMSEEKARAQARRFQSAEAIMEVLDAAYAEGIRVFMCTTHNRVGEICEHVRRREEKYAALEFYPCMPYAHKYANAVTEYGVIEALRRFLPEDGVLAGLFKGGVAVATKDVETIAQLLIDAEMKMFDGLKTPVIFLQNVVTDLLLGLRFREAFRIFADYIQKRYSAEPGFITMNMPMLLDVLEDVGIENPIICSNVNKIGFRMCGGIDRYERIIATRKFRPIAMSVLASGAIPPKEAIEYVCGQPAIQSIVFGASSRGNIRQVRELVDSLTRPSGAQGHGSPLISAI